MGGAHYCKPGCVAKLDCHRLLTGKNVSSNLTVPIEITTSAPFGARDVCPAVVIACRYSSKAERVFVEHDTQEHYLVAVLRRFMKIEFSGFAEKSRPHLSLDGNKTLCRMSVNKDYKYWEISQFKRLCSICSWELAGRPASGLSKYHGDKPVAEGLAEWREVHGDKAPSFSLVEDIVEFLDRTAL